MGANIVRRLMRDGTIPAASMTAIPRRARRSPPRARPPSPRCRSSSTSLDAPRAVWVMLPAGAPTEQTIDALAPLLSPGDVIIDGGNTFWQDDIRRGAALAAKGLHYVDVGTSGGVWGLERGYCMMIGGDAARRPPARSDLQDARARGTATFAPTPNREGRDPRVEQGYMHAGPCGAGHFVKMIHNGIEYGMMQAYAEGFDILRNADVPALKPRAPLHPRPRRYRRGLAARQRGDVLAAGPDRAALAHEGGLESYSGFVEDSGEGRWTFRRRSRRRCRRRCSRRRCSRASARARAIHSRRKIISAMRKGFGGHVEPKKA